LTRINERGIAQRLSARPQAANTLGRDGRPLLPKEDGRMKTLLMLGGAADCQEFRVWAGIMGKKESHYVSTQRTCDPV